MNDGEEFLNINWCDGQIPAAYFASGEGTKRAHYLSPITTSSATTGGLIGDTAAFLYTDIRLFLQDNVNNGFVMKAADTNNNVIAIGPFVGPPPGGPDYVNGTGPLADRSVNVGIGAITAPTPYDMGFMPPVRLIVAVDRQPTEPPTTNTPQAQEVLDFTPPGAVSFPVCHVKEENRGRFAIVLDKIYYFKTPDQAYIIEHINWLDVTASHEPLYFEARPRPGNLYDTVQKNAPLMWIGSPYIDGAGQGSPLVALGTWRTVYVENKLSRRQMLAAKKL